MSGGGVGMLTGISNGPAPSPSKAPVLPRLPGSSLISLPPA
jgi:hypothetical protein